MATSPYRRDKNEPLELIANASGRDLSGRILNAAGAHRDPDVLFRVLVQELRSVVPVHMIGLVHYDEFEAAVQWCALDNEGESPSFYPLFRWEGSACHWVYQSQQPLVIDRVNNGSRFNGFLDFLSQFGVVSACVLPVATAQRRLGAMFFASRHAEFYSSDRVQRLSAVASQVALAMDGAFSFAALQVTRARLESETTKLKLLLDLNNAVVSDLELATLVERISPRLRELMRLDAVALILPDSDNRALRLHALDFPNRSTPEPDCIQEDSIAAQVFHSGTPWIGIVKALQQSSVPITGLRSLCALPLIRRDRVLGVLGLGRSQESAFAEGDIDFLLQVANQVAIAVDNCLEYSRAAVSSEPGLRELYFADEIEAASPFKEVIGKSSALRQILQRVETVAPTESTVLIYGETGTGKELIARAIHELSTHKRAPFVKVNCAAMPPGLLESELFGHERGAFTGASAQRIGRFELANQGTIFLDEISELPLELQPKLLRVLQEREFERLGSSRTLRTNARLIAATNRDLKLMVSEQRFRDDLFYRLNVFPLELPPLRKRPEDIPLLVSHFTQRFAQRLGKYIKSIPSAAMDALTNYHWPGNIRELQNVIERAAILSQGPTLQIAASEFAPDTVGRTAVHSATLQEVERRHIMAVLKESNWVFSGPGGAAARLGMKRSTLQFKLKKLGISRPN